MFDNVNFDNDTPRMWRWNLKLLDREKGHPNLNLLKEKMTKGYGNVN